MAATDSYDDGDLRADRGKLSLRHRFDGGFFLSVPIFSCRTFSLVHATIFGSCAYFALFARISLRHHCIQHFHQCCADGLGIFLHCNSRSFGPVQTSLKVPHGEKCSFCVILAKRHSCHIGEDECYITCV